MTIFYCRDYLFRIKLHGWPNYYLPKALYHISNTWQVLVQFSSKKILCSSFFLVFNMINKTKTEHSFFSTTNWPKIGWALRLSNNWDSIQSLYNYKKDQLGSAAITFNSVFVCRKGWSKYWFCLYIVVFWTRAILSSCIY